jgi:ribosome-binding protein aMBF1 (putative translation factor)
MSTPIARIDLTEKTTTKDLSNFLREARHRTKHTQLDVSKKMEIPPTAVARLESGTLEPKLLTMSRFARSLGKKLVVVII